MTEIKYHNPRLPDEQGVYEVYYTKGGRRGKKHIGSIYFKKLNDDDFKEIDCNLHGTRERGDRIHDAAKRLVREKKAEVVYDEDGEKVVELVEY